MKLLVRAVDDNGMIIGSQKETIIEPTDVKYLGIEIVYTFEVEYHELNKDAYYKYLSEKMKEDNDEV